MTIEIEFDDTLGYLVLTDAETGNTATVDALETAGGKVWAADVDFYTTTLHSTRAAAIAAAIAHLETLRDSADETARRVWKMEWYETFDGS